MTAEYARELATSSVSDAIKNVFDRIEEAAKQGKMKIHINKNIVTDPVYYCLKEKGFSMTEDVFDGVICIVISWR